MHGLFSNWPCDVHVASTLCGFSSTVSRVLASSLSPVAATGRGPRRACRARQQETAHLKRQQHGLCDAGARWCAGMVMCEVPIQVAHGAPTSRLAQTQDGGHTLCESPDPLTCLPLLPSPYHLAVHGPRPPTQPSLQSTMTVSCRSGSYVSHGSLCVAPRSKPHTL